MNEYAEICENCGKNLTKVDPHEISYELKRSLKPKIQVCQDCYVKGLKEENHQTNLAQIILACILIVIGMVYFCTHKVNHAIGILIIGVANIYSVYERKKLQKKYLP